MADTENKAHTGAKLIVYNDGGDKTMEREIIFFDYSFRQPVDSYNQPSGIPRGGIINLTVKALENNADIYVWMISELSQKSGKIEVMNPGEPGKVMKKLEFTEAFCINYTERWLTKDTNEKYPHTESFSITCKTFTNATEFVSAWEGRQN